jgi:hypothetical protein
VRIINQENLMSGRKSFGGVRIPIRGKYRGMIIEPLDLNRSARLTGAEK